MNANWIWNADGSIYHLQLRPDQVADFLILVGDPERVAKVSRYFDRIEHHHRAREFVSCTGSFANKRMTVLSTGIGSDNIDIVLNEYDALLNLDPASGEPLDSLRSMDIVRLGTSGSIQPDIEVDRLLLSRWAVDTSPVIGHYRVRGKYPADIRQELAAAEIASAHAFLSPCDSALCQRFSSAQTAWGCTYTASGFYGPQGRRTRITQQDGNLVERLAGFRHPECGRITNIEMETGTIYGLALLLGHRALSINAILANRSSNRFSAAPERAVEKMIQYFFERLQAR